MIPYNAIDTDDAEAIVPWTNIGLIVLWSSSTSLQSAGPEETTHSPA